jgi:hypothetical protein
MKEGGKEVGTGRRGGSLMTKKREKANEGGEGDQ